MVLPGARTRRALTALVAAALGAITVVGLFPTAAEAQPLTAGAYTLVQQRSISSTMAEYEYRAVLTNAGATPIAKVNSALVALLPTTTVVDGVVTFDNVPPGGTSVSTDTFKVRRPKSVPLVPGEFVWTHSLNGSFTIGGYVLVRERRLNALVSDFDYRAMLTNRGAVAVGGATATVVSGSAATTVLDGTLSFESVPAGASRTSTDTFTLRRLRVLPLVPAVLGWTVAPTLTPTNRPPIARISSLTVRVEPGVPVTLDGTTSSDPDGTPIASYLWELTARPATSVATLNATTASAAFAPDVVGSYTVRLTVGDGSLTGATTLTFSTANRAPNAVIAPLGQAFVTQALALNGTGSADPDGDALQFAWAVTERPAGSVAAPQNATNAVASFSPDRAGTYEIRLIVSDGTLSDSEVASFTTVNSAPVANAGTAQTAPVGTVVTLDASRSTDVDGDALSHVWSVTARPTGSLSALSDPSVVMPTFRIDAPGTYQFQLVVRDSNNAVSQPSFVTVSTINSPPVADAGPDQSVAGATFVQLTGAGSTDADGDPIAYAWQFVQVPAGSTAGLADATTVSPSFVADRRGTFIVRLRTSDPSGAFTTDTMSVTTANSAPVANAGPDQALALGALVQLNGSGSTDVDGDTLGYGWSFTSRPQGSAAALSATNVATPTFALDVPGLYTLQLLVGDGQGGSSADTVSITTLNARPVANAGPDQSATAGQPVTLDGRASADADGDALSFEWALTTRPPGSVATLSNITVPQPTFVADVPGTYVAQLTVSDATLTSLADTVTITTGNTAPVADPGTAPSRAALGVRVDLDGRASRDADGHALTYAWSLLTRPIGSSAVLGALTGPTTFFTPDVGGDFIVQLVVNDGFVNSAPATVLVRANTRPVANAGVDRTVITGVLVTLNGGGSTDVDLDTLTFSWTLTAPQGSEAALTNALTSTPSFVADMPGVYVARLTVNDGLDDSLVDEVTVTAEVAAAGLGVAPATQSALTFGTVPITVTTTQPAGPGGLQVTLTSSDPSTVGVPASVTILPGQTTASVDATAGASAGTATINASAPSASPASATVTVALRTMVVQLAGPTVQVNETLAGTVILGQPAPAGGVTISLTSSAPGVLTVLPASIVIASGGTSGALSIFGMGIGAGSVLASAPGFAGASAAVTSTMALALGPTPFEVERGATRVATLSLSAPAPTGGLTATLRSDDTGRASVPASVTVAAGFSVAEVVVTGVIEGTTTVRASAAGVQPAALPVTVIRPSAAVIDSSPASGEGSVAVTRETILRFSRPIANPELITPQTLFAQFGGQVLPTRIHVSPDRRTVTLFYLQTLPASARVRVQFQTNGLVDVLGVALDGNRDGQPGGLRLIDFDTLTLTTLPGTAVLGRVFASQLGDGGVNTPLAGVVVSVDGLETTLRTTTDAMGNFRLEPSPVGEFFVHIDGRTATNGVPVGAYYPVVGKKWESTAQQATTIPDVFLPLIVPDTLQPVSQTQDTVVTFPASVRAQDPRLNGVQLTVPADSLYSDNGARGGMVGIAPVAPDRIPSPLPPGLNLPLVITVQTDGATNFDRPVPVCFPNLPDPTTGQLLTAGAKSALWSFNHDIGDWEVVGPMTVSTNGALACSDSSVGIRQPGWHGTASGTQGEGPASTPGPGLGATCVAQVAVRNLQALPALMVPDHAPVFRAALAAGTIIGPIGTQLPGTRTAAEDLIRAGGQLEQLQTQYGAGRRCLDVKAAARQLRSVIQAAMNGLSREAIPQLSGSMPALAGQLETARSACVSILSSAPGCSDDSARSFCDGLSPLLDGLRGGAADILDDLSQRMAEFTAEQLQAAMSSLDRLEAIPCPEDGAPIDPLILDYLTDASTRFAPLRSIDLPQLGSAFAVFDALKVELELAGRAWRDVQREPRLPPDMGQISVDPLPAPREDRMPAQYYVESRPPEPQAGNPSIRGTTNGNGGYVFVLRASTPYVLRVYRHASRTCGVIFGTSAGSSGTRFSVAGPAMSRCDGPDGDGDGLTDVAEIAVGTNPLNADSDDDGISDEAEIDQGLDPLGGVSARTGTVTTAETPGTAVDVAARNDIAVVADSDRGVSVLNVAAGLNPVIVAQVDTPGTAQAVALEGNLVAVADGPAGLAIVDITDPPAAGIVRQLSSIVLGGGARAVTVAGGTAYVGLDSNRVVTVDLATGVLLESFPVAGPLQDVLIERDTLYVLSTGQLDAVPLQSPLAVAGSSPSPGSAVSRRLRLFAGGGVAYATQLRGYNTFSLSNPNQPTLIAAGETGQFGWKQIVANGSGLGLAAVSPNSTDDGPHNVSLYDVSDSTQTDRFITEFETPGIASAVSIYNGVAYVADSAAGLQVLNYLAPDRSGVPPTIGLESNYSLSGSTGSAEEGKVMRLTATVDDDVQVRNVEFYVNGILGARDGNFPFEHRFTTPLIGVAPTFTVRACAFDTGGNRTCTADITVTLVDDATPPRVIRATPRDGSNHQQNTLTSLTATFSETIDATTLSPSTFLLFGAGPDGQTNTGDDVPVTSGTVSYNAQASTALMSFGTALPIASYRAVLRAGVTDAAGIPMNEDFAWTFVVRGEKRWMSDVSGSWHTASNWSDNELPQPGDFVVIDRPGVDVTVTYSQGTLSLNRLDTTETLVVSGSSDLSIEQSGQLAALSFTGGVIRGAGTLTTASFAWSGGQLAGTGSLVVTGASTIAAGGPSITQRTLRLGTSTSWTGAPAGSAFSMSNGARIVNPAAGVWTVTAGSADAWFSSGPAGPEIVNDGTFRKVGGNLNIYQAFVSTGTVDLQGGSVILLGGGRNAGMILGSPGSTLEFQSTFDLEDTSQVLTAGEIVMAVGTVMVRGQFSPASLRVDGGTGTFDGQTGTIGTLTHTNGAINGPSVVLASALVWNGGVFQNPGEVRIAGPSTITGGQIIERTLTLGPTTTWSGTSLQMGNGATIVNPVGSVLDVSFNGLIFPASGAQPRIVNQGTLRRGGMAVSDLSGVFFENTGVTEVQAGTLGLGQGSATGAFNVAANAVLSWSRGNYDLAPSSEVTSAGEVEMIGGVSLIVRGVFDVERLAVANASPEFVGPGASIGTLVAAPYVMRIATTSPTVVGAMTLAGGVELTSDLTLGSLEWTAGGFGMFDGGGRVSVAGQTAISPSGALSLFNTRLTLGPSSTWSGGGTLTVGAGAVIEVGAGELLQIDGPAHISCNSGCIGARVDNDGTLRKSGPGLLTVSAPLENAGLVDVADGTLSLNGGTSSGSFAVASPATLRLAGVTTLEAGSAVTALGAVEFSGPSTVAGAFSAGALRILSGSTTFNGTVGAVGSIALLGPNTSPTLIFNTAASVSVPSLTIEQGALRGTASLATGTFSWAAGAVEIASLTVTGSTTLPVFAGGFERTLSTSTLTLGTGTTFAPSAGFSLGAAANVVNPAEGVWELQGDSTVGVGLGAGDGVVSNAGTIRMTGQTSTFTVGGGRFVNTGTVAVRLGGTALGQFDRVQLGLPATLGGTLDVGTFGGFVPASGDAFDVVAYPSRTGEFATIQGNGRTYVPAHGPSSLTLTVP